MRNQESFVGWDFPPWVSGGHYNLFPLPTAFGQSRATARGGAEMAGFADMAVNIEHIDAPIPTIYFIHGNTATIGQDTYIDLFINKPLLPIEIFIGGTKLVLTMGHSGVGFGEIEDTNETYIILQSSFLNTLEPGPHSLMVVFEDGIIVEEQIVILDDSPIARVYVGGTLVYTAEQDFLVDESFFDNIPAGTVYRIEFENGRVQEDRFE